MTPQEFASKWSDSSFKVRAGVQEHWAGDCHREGTRI